MKNVILLAGLFVSFSAFAQNDDVPAFVKNIVCQKLETVYGSQLSSGSCDKSGIFQEYGEAASYHVTTPSKDGYLVCDATLRANPPSHTPAVDLSNCKFIYPH